MFINTKRKVSNIQFLELPQIKMEWKMDWLTGSNKTGHNVFPCPSAGPEWDAYADFRSQSIDLKLTIECKHLNGIRILLFSTSLRWLDVFWKSITDVSRPIKRGTGSWCDQRPGKKRLSRHYRETSFQWKFSNAVFSFRQGYNKQLGFTFVLVEGTFETHHLLSIIRQEGEGTVYKF